MQRVSTNLTLFLKVFIPVFWAIFFGAMLIALFVNKDFLGQLNTSSFRIGAVFFYLSGLATYYFLLFNLKRVEFSAEHAYATNYFKTYRYSWDSIQHLEESSFLFFTIVSIVLHEAGAFGKRITFIASKKGYRKFMTAQPQTQELVKKI